MEIKTVEFERPAAAEGTSCTAAAWARVPEALSADKKAALKDRIRHLLKERGAVLVAHYYVDADLQDLAEETGGCVSDSLEMARFGRDHAAQTLVVAGVRFMGETAKILSPEKTVRPLVLGDLLDSAYLPSESHVQISFASCAFQAESFSLAAPVVLAESDQVT